MSRNYIRQPATAVIPLRVRPAASPCRGSPAGRPAGQGGARQAASCQDQAAAGQRRSS